MSAKTIFRLVRLPCLVLVVASVSFARAEAPAGPDEKCLECHSDPALSKFNAAGREISLFVDPQKLALTVHLTNTCVSCHVGVTENHPDDNLPVQPVDCKRCHEQQSESYGASVHGLALTDGNKNAPGCVDCHAHHEVLPHTSPQSPLHFSNLARTCGACHEQESSDLQASVHGRGAAKGEREAATCLDCHSEHKIEKLHGASSVRISQEICSKCHASERINAKYNLPGDRVKTFLGSYHGLAVQGRSAKAANCASCHGYHKILPSSDPDSSINPNHLVETCGKCHPGATENFALGRVHVDEESEGEEVGMTVNRWVRRIYLVLIFAVIGALATHNLLAWLRSAMAARRARGTTVMRMSLAHRIQHFILLSSFILLALTGFALKYPETWLAWMFVNEGIRHWLHRGAGVILIGLGCYHLFYIFVTHEGRRLVKDFWPCWQDVRDIVMNLRYLAGRSTVRARFGRFGYPEKLEYWAVAWGIVIMGVTGLMIWFKLEVTGFLPRWVVDVAITVHYYEAILACLAIVVWHFYHVIFAPDIYPMNWSWWDGRVSQEWQEHEHSLENPPSNKENTSPCGDDI